VFIDEYRVQNVERTRFPLVVVGFLVHELQQSGLSHLIWRTGSGAQETQVCSRGDLIVAASQPGWQGRNRG
jgi:hypothetical protein